MRTPAAPFPRLAPLAVLLVALVGSCAPAPPGGGSMHLPGPGPYQDAVTDPSRVRSSLGEVDRDQHFCAEKTYFAMGVGPGETLSARFTSRPDSRLVVSGCAPDRGSLSPDATLELREEVAGEVVATHQLPLDRRGWWSEELVLEAPPSPDLVVTVRSGSRVGSPVYLRDLHLRTGPPRVPSGADVPRILLVSVDTWRADTIHALGGDRPTPAIDRLVAQSQVWTEHRSADSWTKPSHAGLLTGYHPDTSRCIGLRAPIDPAIPTLASRLRDAGFATAGLVHACEWLDPEYGFDAGFSEYRVEKWYLRQMVRESVNWMVAHSDEPFFYFLHTYDVHSDFNHLPYEGRGATPARLEQLFGASGYGCTGGHCGSIRLADINKGLLDPLPNEAAILDYLYGCGVESLDSELAVLLGDLRRAGLLDRMLVVVTSDHGESFLEHGRVLHGTFWDEVLRVPLIIRWPGGLFAGTRRAERVTAYDVAPTLLTFAGVPHHDLPGVVLGAQPVADRTLFLGTAGRVVIDGPLKAIFHPDGTRALLYDLDTDPDEQIDLAAQRPETVARLRRLLDRQRRTDRELHERLAAGSESMPSAPDLSEEERERLRQLGYL